MKRLLGGKKMELKNIKSLIVDDWVLVDGEVLEVTIEEDALVLKTKRGIRIPGEY